MNDFDVVTGPGPTRLQPLRRDLPVQPPSPAAAATARSGGAEKEPAKQPAIQSATRHTDPEQGR